VGGFREGNGRAFRAKLRALGGKVVVDRKRGPSVDDEIFERRARKLALGGGDSKKQGGTMNKRKKPYFSKEKVSSLPREGGSPLCGRKKAPTDRVRRHEGKDLGKTSRGEVRRRHGELGLGGLAQKAGGA